MSKHHFIDNNKAIAETLAWIIIGLNWLLYTPVVCGLSIEYYRYRYNRILRKHYINITYSIIFFVLLDSILFEPLLVLYWTYFRLEFGYPLNFLWAFTIHGLKWSILLKVYFIWFDINYAYYNYTKNWQHIISKSSLTSNWFIINKHKLGNLKWVFIRIIFPLSLFTILISTLLWQYSSLTYASSLQFIPFLHSLRLPNLIAWLFDVITTFIPISFGIILYCLTPKFVDNIKFVDSSKWMFLFSLIWISTILIYFLLLELYGINGRLYFAFIVEQIKKLSEIGIVFSCTHLVIYKVKQIDDYNFEEDITSKDHTTHSTPLSTTHRTLKSLSATFKLNERPTIIIAPLLMNNHSFSDTFSLNGNDIDSKSGLIKLLCGRINGVHAFVLHLNTEFEMELILSFIEFNDFLLFILSHYPNISSSWNQYKPLIFCDDMPDSDIIKQNHDQYNIDLYKIGASLYNKYIVLGASYEIMLSQDLRNKFDNEFGTNGFSSDDEQDEHWIIEIGKLFIYANHELLTLMWGSYRRFRNKYHK